MDYVKRKNQNRSFNFVSHIFFSRFTTRQFSLSQTGDLNKKYSSTSRGDRIEADRTLLYIQRSLFTAADDDDDRERWRDECPDRE